MGEGGWLPASRPAGEAVAAAATAVVAVAMAREEWQCHKTIKLFKNESEADG